MQTDVNIISKEPLITIDLQSNGGKISFWSIDDVENWIAKEEEFWGWVRTNPTRETVWQNILADQTRHWSPVKQQISSFRSQSDPEQAKRHLEQIEKLISDAYSFPKSLHSSTPAAKLVEGIRQVDNTAAVYALGYFIRKTVAPTTAFNISAIVGLIQALLFDKNVHGLDQAEREALNKLREEYQADLTNIKKQAKENDELIQHYQGDFSNLLASSKDNFKNFMASSEQELENVTKTYDEKMALQSSVTYWTKKAERHKNLARKFAYGFTCGLIVLGGGMALEVFYLLKDSSAIEHWKYGLLAVSALIVVWICRIIVRVLFSHIHLERDASERVTMIQTYLAMLREGQGPKDENRTLILQTLFRPSSSGIIKDDAIPTSFLELITRSGH